MAGTGIRVGAAGVIAVVVLAAAGATTPSTSGATGLPVTGVSAPDIAAARTAAAAWVARRPALLRAGPEEAFAQGTPLASMGWRYVPYTRTYRGLPVVGGDFVVVVGPDARVRWASVAQRRSIGELDPAAVRTRTAVGSRPAAGSQLVVYALGSTPRLAWEMTTRDASGAGMSIVDVDATSGAVLSRRDTTHFGTGISTRNGPGPLTIYTTRVQQNGIVRFIMRNPNSPGMSCGDDNANAPFIDDIDRWGNGDPTNIVTGCVDALFAAQNETRMVAVWLGRNGLNGTGGAWPMWVGLDQVNSAFTSTGNAVFGHDTTGKWLTSLDVVGHELGHGIDTTTPGGLSGGNTMEFIADVLRGRERVVRQRARAL